MSFSDIHPGLLTKASLRSNGGMSNLSGQTPRHPGPLSRYQNSAGSTNVGLVGSYFSFPSLAAIYVGVLQKQCCNVWNVVTQICEVVFGQTVWSEHNVISAAPLRKVLSYIQCQCHSLFQHWPGLDAIFVRYYIYIPPTITDYRVHCSKTF